MAIGTYLRGFWSRVKDRRAYARRGPRTIRLRNDTNKTLAAFVGPYVDQYDIPAGAVAELRGLDPGQDVVDVGVHVDPEGVCLSFECYNQIEVTVDGRRLSQVLTRAR